MGASDVKLLASSTSPYAMRARIALNIKSVDYEYVEERHDAKSELLLKSNPIHKKVPVLIHGDKPICESLIIVQYIDEFWSSGPQILPSDPYNRAITRFWAAYIDDKWFPPLMGMITAGGEETRRAAAEQLREGLELLQDVFKKCSNGNKFFGGDKIGYLDITLGCYLGWLRVVEKLNNVNLLDVVMTPDLYKWAQDFCADSSVKNVLPQTDKLIESAKILRAITSAPHKN